MYLAFGIMSALHEARNSGKGQVVDAGMLDGTTSLMTMIYGLFASGYWTDQRGTNRLDSGAPWYSVYETSDGRYVAVGSTEASFYKNTVRLLGLNPDDFSDQHDKSGWPHMKDAFAKTFKTRTRDEWCTIFEGADACFSPVLSLAEAPTHPHQVARGNFVECAGLLQPAPAPRFSRTGAAIQSPPAKVGEHTDEVLSAWGFGIDEVDKLRQCSAI